jgi:hypothetical protein
MVRQEGRGEDRHQVGLNEVRSADLPGRHLHILLAQHPDDVVHRQIPRLQLGSSHTRML